MPKLNTNALIAVMTDEEFEIQKQKVECHKGFVFYTHVPLKALINLSFINAIKPDFTEEKNVCFSEEAVKKLNIQDSDLYDRENENSKFFYIVNSVHGYCFLTVTLKEDGKKPILEIEKMEGLVILEITKDIYTGIQTTNEI